MGRSLEKPVADPTYLEFFGLTRPPFTRLAETSQLYHAEQYSLLMEHLASARKQPDSFVAICGVDGSGKTTLLNQYMSSLGDQISFVAVDETCHGEEQFYREFLTQIGFTDITGTPSELQNITREFLVYSGHAGDPVLIIIDNAHLVDPIILEQLRSLSEIEVKGHRVVSIVLAGNADLLRVIDSPALSQTKFRSHVVFNIRNYTEEETASYVWHRLRLAGGNDGVILANEAIPLIQRYSGGTPQLINRLCNDLLTEAYSLESRVITDRIVRSVADKQRILPHVIPLHGKGRRRTDPDFNAELDVPDSEERAASGASKAGEPVEAAAAYIPGADSEKLVKRVSALTKQVDDLRADKLRALKEIGAHVKDIRQLRDELNSKTAEIETLSRSLDGKASESTQLNAALSSSASALHDSKKMAQKLAAELQKEMRAKDAAQSDLAKAEATVDELSRLKEGLQKTVDDLEAELDANVKAADERAAEIEALEKNTAGLKEEIEGKTAELTSLREELETRNAALQDLEGQLAAAQKESAAAERRVKALKAPKELKALEKAADKLTADLEKERQIRAAAENDLSQAAATVDELSQQKQELEAKVDELTADLKSELTVAGERAVEIEALEKSSAALKDEIETKTGEMEALRGELDSLKDELVARNQSLADLEAQLEASQQECASAERRMEALKSPEELQKLVDETDKLAAGLEEEARTREAAENELAKATATVDELSRLKEDMQATIDELEADLSVGLGLAADRAAEIEALEKSNADLKDEIETKASELESVREELAARNKSFEDLEARLEASQKDYASAQRRMEALKSPEELQKLVDVSEQLTADLEEETRSREAAENELAKATASVDELSRLKEETQATVDKLTAELQASVEAVNDRTGEIEALENKAALLREEVESKDRELDSLRNELDARNQIVSKLEERLDRSQSECELAQLRMRELKSPSELKEIEDASEKLAADLEKETVSREAAEAELTKATQTIEELSKLKSELQASVDDLQAKLEVAGERAADIETLETNSAYLKAKIEGKDDELASLREELQSRNQVLADIEKQLAESEQARASAEGRIAELKDPEELKALEESSENLARELEQEKQARVAAETELAKATQTVEELNRFKAEMQATVEGLDADAKTSLEKAQERAAEIETLEKSAADLEVEIDRKAGELDTLRIEFDSLKDKLASRNEALADLESRLEESQNENAAARDQIAELQNPQELEEVRTVSRRLAADLEQEQQARKAAENELAKATATIEELRQLRKELQANIRDLNADLKLASERAIDFDVLERTVTTLKDEIEKKAGELESRNKTLVDLEKDIESSRRESERMPRRAPAQRAAVGSAPKPVAPVQSSTSGVHKSLVVEKFEHSLSNVPAYQTLQEYDPAFYDDLITTYKELIGLDRSNKQVNDVLRARQAGLIEKLIPRASDEAVYAYAQVIVDQLHEFRLVGAEPCFTLLVPQASRDNEAPVFTERTKERELDVLDMTLKTHDADRQLPGQDDVWGDLEPIFLELFEVYGEENVLALQNSGDPGIDRDLVCTISDALYSGILKLPKRRAVKALRWLLSP